MLPTIELHIVEASMAQTTAEILHDALPLPERLWKIINDPSSTTYAAYHIGDVVGGAIVRWSGQSEIMALGVRREKRGQGVGQAVVANVIKEARKRNVSSVLVGTSSIALDNILFYQRCGFRMSHVRRNYFPEAYPEFSVEWRGVKLLDMIVFEYTFPQDGPGNTRTNDIE